MASSLAFFALLLCFCFSVNPQPFDYPTAIAPTSWTNSPSLPHSVNTLDGATVRSLLLRQDSAGYFLSFAAGFYCFPPCKSFFLSIFIISSNSGGGITLVAPPQVIWSANRAQPVSENATLQLTSQNGLTLRDSNGSLVWTTDVANRSVVGMNITESGTLVLYDINNFIIWQSSDYPTDSLIMGQTLVGGMRIIANSSSTNLTKSNLYLTLFEDGLFGFVESDPPQMYYSGSGNRTVDKSTFMRFMNGSLTMFSTLSNPNKTKILFQLPLATSKQYMRLESDGHLRLYDFNRTHWNMVDDLLKMNNCDYPTVCGKYGICNNGQCTCPTHTGTLENYFVPVDNRQAELGCYAVTPITCQDVNNHLMLDLNNVSYFNTIDLVAFSPTDEDSCKKACLGNCSCKAAMFEWPNGNSSAGTCYTLPDVFSLRNHLLETAHYNSSAYIKVQSAPSPPSTPPPPSNSKVGLGAILGSTFGALLFMLTLISMYLVCSRRREEAQDEDFMEQLPGMPTRFTFEELRMATENFVKKLGEGGFGTVFEGRWGDERIAVKRLENVGHGNKDFLAEVETIGSIHHINLVRLVGFCADKLNRLLVYEYMCNGSLDKWIYCRDGRVSLDWLIRFKIITHIAKGLCYLHEECRQRIVHFDIKPENILLDENFDAKVSDFGLSKLIDRDMSRVMTGMRGTPGYLAPEWLTAMVSEKVDVYSFGVVVMEILSGRRNLDYSQTEENCHLIKLLEEKSKSNGLSDLIDKNLGDVELYKKKIVNVMKLAMWCLQWDSTKRPSMLMVVKVLDGAMEVETSLDYNFVSSIPMISNISCLAPYDSELKE
ncbi:G-type lectin S-receptor-like serine/threonine-protein kinase SD2-5 [Carex rostrata]